MTGGISTGTPSSLMSAQGWNFDIPAPSIPFGGCGALSACVSITGGALEFQGNCGLLSLINGRNPGQWPTPPSACITYTSYCQSCETCDSLFSQSSEMEFPTGEMTYAISPECSLKFNGTAKLSVTGMVGICVEQE